MEWAGLGDMGGSMQCCQQVAQNIVNPVVLLALVAAATTLIARVSRKEKK